MKRLAAVAVTAGLAFAPAAQAAQAPTKDQASAAIQHAWHGWRIRVEWCGRSTHVTRCKVFVPMTACHSYGACYSSPDIEIDYAWWKAGRLVTNMVGDSFTITCTPFPC